MPLLLLLLQADEDTPAEDSSIAGQVGSGQRHCQKPLSGHQQASTVSAYSQHGLMQCRTTCMLAPPPAAAEAAVAAGLQVGQGFSLMARR